MKKLYRTKPTSTTYVLDNAGELEASLCSQGGANGPTCKKENGGPSKTLHEF